MANTRQARKRVRQASKHRDHNASMRSMARTYIKNTVKAIEEKNKTAAEEAFKKMVPVLDNLVNKKIFHRNKVARHKSRLNAQIKAMA